MKRVSLFIVALFLLSSCAQPSPLPTDEVLKSAARVSQELQSAHFRTEIDFEGDVLKPFDIRGKAEAHGRLQDGGNQVQFSTSIRGSAHDPQGKMYGLKGAGEIIVAGQEEVYLFVRSLSIDPGVMIPLVPILKEFAGQWWQLSAPPKGVQSPTIAPDPKFLQAQSKVVNVLKDYGLKSINGRTSYHYDVEFDIERFADFLEEVARVRDEEFDREKTLTSLKGIKTDGELWIDAQSFEIHRIVWDVASTEGAKSPFALHIIFDVFDHNNAKPIVPPEEFKVFAPFDPALRIPEPLTGEELIPDTLPPGLEGDILDAILDETE
jgi:hypothetical protein